MLTAACGIDHVMRQRLRIYCATVISCQMIETLSHIYMADACLRSCSAKQGALMQRRECANRRVSFARKRKTSVSALMRECVGVHFPIRAQWVQLLVQMHELQNDAARAGHGVQWRGCQCDQYKRL
jgi:hypothetical protein